MGKSRFDFIKELLENKKIKPDQRERILELTSKELDQSENLEARIKKIEEKLSIQNSDSRKIKIQESKVLDSTGLILEESKLKKLSISEYTNPYWVYEYLSEYNQNEVLKYTSHDISMSDLDDIKEYCGTDNYEFEKHLEIIIEEFEKHDKRFSKCSYKLRALVRAYLTGKSKDKKVSDDTVVEWSTDKIQVNWSDSGLLDWSRKNPGIPPNLNLVEMSNMEIEAFPVTQIDSLITESSIQNFTQLVLHFKNSFHIKYGAQSLKEIICRTNRKFKWDERIDFEITNENFPNNLELFTDVDKLTQAYHRIIELILKKSKGELKPKIKLGFFAQDNSLYLSIHHLNGVVKKSKEDFVNREIGLDLTRIIRKQLNGLCNLYVRADFGSNQYAKINLWNGKPREAIPTDPLQGIEHILQFPKTKKS